MHRGTEIEADNGTKMEPDTGKKMKAQSWRSNLFFSNLCQKYANLSHSKKEYEHKI